MKKFICSWTFLLTLAVFPSQIYAVERVNDKGLFLFLGFSVDQSVDEQVKIAKEKGYKKCVHHKSIGITGCSKKDVPVYMDGINIAEIGVSAGCEVFDGCEPLISNEDLLIDVWEKYKKHAKSERMIAVKYMGSCLQGKKGDQICVRKDNSIHLRKGTYGAHKPKF